MSPLLLFLFAAGLAVLILGAWALIEGGVKVARILGIPPVVIGLTVVAFGTSAPEFFVSLVGALRGSTGLVLGNVMGSNVANLGLILAAAGLLNPMRVERQLKRKSGEIPLMGLATLAFVVMMWDGSVGRLDAALLSAGFAYFMLRAFRSRPGAEGSPVVPKVDIPEPEADIAESRLRPLLAGSLLTLGGIVGLALGGRLITDAAVRMAQALGVSEALVGLTMVAVGTSLPELATTVMAAWRREGDLALGNIFGSNIFNLLGVAGPVGLIHPLHADTAMATVAITGWTLPGYRLQAITLLGITLLAGALALSAGKKFGRAGGSIMLVGYILVMTIWMS